VSITVGDGVNGTNILYEQGVAYAYLPNVARVGNDVTATSNGRPLNGAGNYFPAGVVFDFQFTALSVAGSHSLVCGDGTPATFSVPKR
jgi:hypothetical protein